MYVEDFLQARVDSHNQSNNHFFIPEFILFIF